MSMIVNSIHEKDKGVLKLEPTIVAQKVTFMFVV